MSFCAACGKILRQQAGANAGNTCHRCGRLDQLNIRYCIFCGNDTTVGADATRELATDDHELSDTDGRAAIQSSGMTRSAQIGLIVAVAAILGVAAAHLLAPILDKVAPKSWPNSSIVLYVAQKDAQIKLYAQDEARTFTIGKVGAGGDLTITDLEPGPYICQVSAPNAQTSAIGPEPKLTVEKNRPTVIGFPKPFQLAPRH
jgi:hypothetical protein